MNQAAKTLQGIFWSKSIDNLDVDRDKTYVVNQVLAFGTMADLCWLFHTYPTKTIRDIFLKSPIKTYSPQARSFAAVILDIDDGEIDLSRYDQSLPRHIR